jgi:hypothetical protein
MSSVDDDDDEDADNDDGDSGTPALTANMTSTTTTMTTTTAWPSRFYKVAMLRLDHYRNGWCPMRLAQKIESIAQRVKRVWLRKDLQKHHPKVYRVCTGFVSGL